MDRQCKQRYHQQVDENEGEELDNHEQQFNVTYTHDDNLGDHLGDEESEGDGWIDREPTPGVTETKPDGEGRRFPEDLHKNEDEDDYSNPMAVKLRKMRLELRGRLDAPLNGSKEGGNNSKNEDMQGYDTYKSPLAKQKLEFALKNIQEPQGESNEQNFKFLEGL